MHPHFRKEKNLILAVLMFCALTWMGLRSAEPEKAEPPQNSAGLFIDYTQPLSPSLLKNDPFKTSKYLQRRFATFNYTWFKQNVITPNSKGTPKAAFQFQLFPKEAPFKAQTTTYRIENGVHLWTGTLESNYFSRAQFSVDENGGFGNFQVDDRVFSFHPIWDGKKIIHVIYEVNQSKLGTCATKEAPNTKYVPKQSQNAMFPIEVLYLLPESFNTTCTDPNLAPLFRRMISRHLPLHLNEALNMEFEQIGITQPVKFSASSKCIPYQPRYGDFGNDIEFLKTDAGIADLRNDVDADLVIMVTPEQDGLVCGRGTAPWPLQPRHSEDAAHAIVAFPCAIPKYSLAHEVGHQMG
ncbi:MAG: hypothetical protein AAF570_01440, partial [Bacteroidota bacterium]